jgi:bifunctional DNase/RNase
MAVARPLFSLRGIYRFGKEGKLPFMLRMIVEAVAFDHRQQKVVLLKDLEGQKILPIWIGPGEARAIALELEGAVPPRPLSHDLLLSTLRTARAHVMRVVINDLIDDTFYATIEIDTPDGVILVDSRPSDAIALAVRAKCPIFAAGGALSALVNIEEILAPGESLDSMPEPPPPPDADDEISRFRRLVGDMDV